jgi:methionyl-tRNA synthetase
VDPAALVRSWGVDAVRYWLLHEVPASGDADYTEGGFARAYTANLANDLGNLLQRTLGMVHRYRDGTVPEGHEDEPSLLHALAAALPATLHRSLRDEWDPRLALDAVLALVRRANRLVDEARPWALAHAERAGDGPARRRLDSVLRDLLETLRLVAEALRPLLPDTAARIAAQLGTAPAHDWFAALGPTGLHTGAPLGTPAPLFPRRDQPSAS